MELTPAQLTTIKNFIAADGTLNAAPNDGNGLRTIADALNTAASPDFIVWRTEIKAHEIMESIVGTELAALTAIKQFVFHMLMLSAPLDASKANIRADFSAIFSVGTSLTALTDLAKRKATVIEKILAIGTGSTASPATMAVEGSITPNQVDTARRS